MALDLSDCQFFGPALPAPFVRFELEKELTSRKLLPKKLGSEGEKLRRNWDQYRRHLQELAASGGPLRVRNKVIEPLIDWLGYTKLEAAENVQTREDLESGGNLLLTADTGNKLRVWTTSFNEDLDAPAQRGRAYRFSHLRIAQRVLLTTGERLGILTNGVELRILISDPARLDSQIIIPLDAGWKRHREVPDSFLLLLALCCPQGVQALPDIVDKARLQQARVTKELRVQAREAVERFIQEILDHPENRDWFDSQPDRAALAKALWHEGLITIYRLLFILKLESSDDPARSFGFASMSLWRNTFSPSMALGTYARVVLERGLETGRLLESGLRSLFRMFELGLECTEMVVKPLGGKLFGPQATPTLTERAWGERAVAWLLDRLLWTPKKRGSDTRERVHYGSLDVEDLGRVYEALLELEPGITAEPMCRLRRQKLEVVVLLAQGERYRPARPIDEEPAEDDEAEEDVDVDEVEESNGRGKKSKVLWIEEIPPHRFYLRVGLGRKASGSYYTPHSFVRFLVQETLGPQVEERSPQNDPKPLEILKLKVLDPAMGSGHFLVEACRFLGEKLYEACRSCDEKAIEAERQAESARTDQKRAAALESAQNWRQRIIELPDTDDELAKTEFVPRESKDQALEPVTGYLPSKSLAPGVSTARAQAICRRLVAVHCLYGVDKNPLAVELAKLALWLESHAEGMPLTFLDHRLIVGDSLTGPFWDKLMFRPGKPDTPVEDLFSQGLYGKLQKALTEALGLVRRLESSVGSELADVLDKEAVKSRLDQALLPFRVAAAAWAGGVMLGQEKCDDLAYSQLLKAIGHNCRPPDEIESDDLRAQIARGLGLSSVPADRPGLESAVNSARAVPALGYDLTFPEVFYPLGSPHGKEGFHAVLGNPPWDAIQFKSKEFFAAFDFEILNAPTTREREGIERRLLADPLCGPLFVQYKEEFEQHKRANDVLYEYQKVYIDGDLAGRQGDAFRVFMERNAQLLGKKGWTGVVVPSAFHANEGATGVRRLYLEKLNLRHCYSFENRRKLFEIDSRFKFATLVAQAGQPTEEFSCAFFLHDDEWLFTKSTRPIQFSLAFIKSTTGEYLSFLEPRGANDLAITESCFRNGLPLGQVANKLSVRFGRECDMALDSWRFTPLKDLTLGNVDPRDFEVSLNLLRTGYEVLHEGRTFRQYDDHWADRPSYVVAISQLLDKPDWLTASRFFRLAHRRIAGPGDENVSIWVILPPSVICGHNAPTEKSPCERRNSNALRLLSVANSFVFDWQLSQRVRATVNAFIRDGIPIPANAFVGSLLPHSALRLSCNHEGYAQLWRDQMGGVWREPGRQPFTWPVLANDDDRWHVRASIDAVVVDAYGLSRDQYAHVLSAFKHTSYPMAPELCLAMFDELKAIGLDAFTKKHDPYWDIPLNEKLPQPVIELPGLEPASTDKFTLEVSSHSGRTRTRKKP